VALISGGDSGIGRAVALAFAREGAKVAFIYLEEDRDAEDTVRLVKDEGSDAFALRGDVGDEDFCRRAVAQTLDRFGRLDVLVNNAAEQHLKNSLEEIEKEQLERTFRTNVFGYFFLTKAALPHLREGSSIINTTSITAYQGHPALMDYAATRGAVVALTRSLAQALIDRKIRVNGVAAGPIWTPLIPATFGEEKVGKHGESVPMGRVGQPNEVAPCFVFLACEDASYMTGQVLHPNGGAIVNG
jgi:NAD(P)-dependent dehydrogenase (short-subunit alcohol dehydrogenase family)